MSWGKNRHSLVTRKRVWVSRAGKSQTSFSCWFNRGRKLCRRLVTKLDFSQSFLRIKSLRTFRSFPISVNPRFLFFIHFFQKISFRKNQYWLENVSTRLIWNLPLLLPLLPMLQVKHSSLSSLSFQSELSSVPFTQARAALLNELQFLKRVQYHDDAQLFAIGLAE